MKKREKNLRDLRHCHETCMFRRERTIPTAAIVIL